MVRQAGFFDVEERLRELSAKGDDLERIAALGDFVLFRLELERASVIIRRFRVSSAEQQIKTLARPRIHHHPNHERLGIRARAVVVSG
jgi:hypothetical protein